MADPHATARLTREDREFLDAWLVGGDFPMAPVVRRLLAEYDALAGAHICGDCADFLRDVPEPTKEETR